MFFASTSSVFASQHASHRSSVGLRSYRSRNSRCSRRGGSWLPNVFQYLSPQDLVVVCGALIVLYLITGDNAELVCDTFTSIPPAVFTYQLLTNGKATTVGYEATLCFWILHGTLVIFDHLLRKTVWYFLAKFVLMAAVSSHVMAKCKTENKQEEDANELNATNQIDAASSFSSTLPESTELTAVRVRRINKRITRAMLGAGGRRRSPRVTPLRRLGAGRRLSASTRFDGVGQPMAADSEHVAAQFEPRFGDAENTPRTQYFQSLSDKLTPPEKRFQQFDDDERIEPTTASKAVQTKSVETVDASVDVDESDTLRKLRPNNDETCDDKDDDDLTEQTIVVETVVHRSASNNSSEKSTFATVTTTAEREYVRTTVYNELREHLAARNGRLGAGDRVSIGSFSTARQTIELMEESFEQSSQNFPSSCLAAEDLIVNRKEITFHDPYHKVGTMDLANSSQHSNIFWEIKTNAADRVFVTPNRGVLPIQQMLKVYINVRRPDDIETPYETLPTINTDRLAIDYVFVAPDCHNFDAGLFNERGAEKRRKNLVVRYVR